MKKLIMVNNLIKKEGFSVIHVTTDEELKKIYDIRYSGEYWKYWEERNCKTEKKFFTDEKVKDSSATVLALKEANFGIIGTIRFTSMHDNLTTTERIMQDRQIINNRLKVSWEIGRLIIIPQKKSQRTLAYLVYLAFKWLVDNKHINYALAHCPYKVARIYRRFGFKIISEKFIMDYCTQEYVVISGSLAETIKILEKLILTKYVNEHNITPD